MSNSLWNLYQNHKGKRSDKWELYLSVYNTLLDPVKDKIETLFEIGIQNGGSLEIWNQYFPEIKKVIGCDINPKCRNLHYDDSRITVLVEDANTPEAVNKLYSSFENGIDLIIDDGSHTSRDIICSFVNYFPKLNDNRFMIIEDLHCSYWKDFGGGLYDPMSSLAFLKKLSDCINYEHWGLPSKTRCEYLAEFANFYQIEFNESVLEQVHSITFYNSVCVITKKIPEKNVLGMRVMAGITQDVISLDNVLLASHAPDQTENFWSNIHRSPESLYPELLERNRSLSNDLSSQQAVIEQIETEKEQLNKDNTELKNQLNHLNTELTDIKNSFGYRFINRIKRLSGIKK